MLDKLTRHCAAFYVRHPSLYKTAVKGSFGIGIALCALALLGTLMTYTPLPSAATPLRDFVGRFQQLLHSPLRSVSAFGGMTGLGLGLVGGSLGVHILMCTEKGKGHITNQTHQKEWNEWLQTRHPVVNDKDF